MRFARGPWWALCAFLSLIGMQPVLAQQFGLPQGTILTVSSEQLFTGSAFGRRVISEIEGEGASLSAENERIIAELSQEERELTEQRATMKPEQFRQLADSFDAKVQSHRESQRAKLEALAERSEKARAMFIELARPVLIELMQESGSGVILERANVFLSSDATDITSIAVTRIDAAIGDGKGLESGDTD